VVPTEKQRVVPTEKQRVPQSSGSWPPNYRDTYEPQAAARQGRTPTSTLPPPSPTARAALSQAAASSPVVRLSPAPSLPPSEPVDMLRHVKRPRKCVSFSLNEAPVLTRLKSAICRPSSMPVPRVALSAITNAGGLVLRYNTLRKGPTAAAWETSCAEEWRRLATDTHTLRFVPVSTKPRDRKATYINLVCTEKVKPPNTFATRRVRATCGNGIDYPGPKSARTAALTTVKILCNSVVSTPGAKFMTIDLKDFYLHSTLTRAEYAWVSFAQLPEETRKEYTLDSLAVNGKVLVEISKGLYGLPQAGKLAQDQLIALLAAHDFYECEFTPCLFRHKTRDLTFSLVVDDFGVKYVDPADAQFLADILLPHYKIHIDWSGDKYLGITLRWEYDAKVRIVSLSLPGFIAKVLSAFGFDAPPRPAHSPGGYIRPVYGSQTQLTEVDASPALSPERKTILMSKIGVLQWYVRVTDPTSKCRLSQLSSLQAHPTERTEKAINDLFHYLHTYPDANLVYRASDMQLHIESDASYNSEPKATSRMRDL
jgi:hypothetical protein